MVGLGMGCEGALFILGLPRLQFQRCDNVGDFSLGEEKLADNVDEPSDGDLNQWILEE